MKPNITPINDNIAYSLIYRQDGIISVPDSMKRSSGSIVESAPEGSELQSGDVIIHSMKWQHREEPYHGNYIMPLSQVYARVVNGRICPIGNWILCKMIPPKSEAGIIDLRAVVKTQFVQVASVSLSEACGDLRIGQKYLISGWETDMHQFEFGGVGEIFMFMKPANLIAEYNE